MRASVAAAAKAVTASRLTHAARTAAKAARQADTPKLKNAAKEAKAGDAAAAIKKLRKIKAQSDDSSTSKPDSNTSLRDRLQQLFGNEPRGRSVGQEQAPAHVDVVSPHLCDDIINYMRPELEQYKGCDIIDIHPGACLWSQKLHDFLKPRRHLLLEPEERYFDPFIKPLLQQKDSTYRHSTLSGAHPKNYWSTYDAIFNDDLLPKRDPLPPGHPALREPNTSLLVIGNLVRRYSDYRSVVRNVHTSSLLLNQMSYAAQSNSLFHRYGLTRMLFWIPQDIASTVLPDSILFRQGFNVGLDSTANLVEIAGQNRGEAAEANKGKRGTQKQRHDGLDIWGAQRVAKRMQDKGMSLPVRRRSLVHQRALDDKVDVEAYNPICLPAGESLQDMVLAQEQSVNTLTEAFKDVPAKYARKPPSPPIPCRFKWTKTSASYIKAADRDRLTLFMDIWGGGIALERELGISKDKISEDEHSDLKRRLLAAHDSLMAVLNNIAQHHSTKVVTLLFSEILALCRDNPLMAWDRRPFEPLMVKPKEFSSNYPMHLLDVMPRRKTFGNDLLNNVEASRLQRQVLQSLFTHTASTLVNALERVGPGVSELDVPEFEDSSKGGRLTRHALTTRDMSLEQLNGLMKAYIEWPFRPKSEEEFVEDVVDTTSRK